MDDDKTGVVEIMGLISMVLGFIAIIIGRIWLLLTAFKEGCLWAIGVLCIDLVALIFVIQHWDEAKLPFLVSVVGWILVVGGAFAGGGM